MTVTGVTDNNWSRIDYNGKVGYINNDMLVSVDPNPAPKPEEKKSEEKKSEEKKEEEKEEEKEKKRENKKLWK